MLTQVCWQEREKDKKEGMSEKETDSVCTILLKLPTVVLIIIGDAQQTLLDLGTAIISHLIMSR